MQWDGCAQAGFTEGTPWLAVNPNCREINVAQALADDNSIFHYYRQLIGLRRHSPWASLMISGSYTPLLAEHPAVLAYLREGGEAEGGRLLVICNFFEPEVTVSLNEQVESVVMANRQDPPLNLQNLALRAYEAVVYQLR